MEYLFIKNSRRHSSDNNSKPLTEYLPGISRPCPRYWETKKGNDQLLASKISSFGSHVKKQLDIYIRAVFNVRRQWAGSGHKEVCLCWGFAKNFKVVMLFSWLCWGELGQSGRQGGISVLGAAGTEAEGWERVQHSREITSSSVWLDVGWGCLMRRVRKQH